MIEFVSYNGKFPNLCSGTLVIKVNGVEYTLPPHSLVSGGAVWFDADWGEHVESGRWKIDLPDNLIPFKEEIENCINENIPWGCCGGCV